MPKIRKLIISADTWLHGVGQNSQPVSTEVTGEDQVRLMIGDDLATVYLSRVAAYEIGKQLIERSVEKWPANA